MSSEPPVAPPMAATRSSRRLHAATPTMMPTEMAVPPSRCAVKGWDEYLPPCPGQQVSLAERPSQPRRGAQSGGALGGGVHHLEEGEAEGALEQRELEDHTAQHAAPRHNSERVRLPR